MKQGLSDRFRSRRDATLRQALARCPRRDGTLRILDVGGRVAYWERFGLEYLRSIGARITLLNMSEIEFDLGRDGGGLDGLFEMAIGNGCALDYADGHFDLCHSNSVIEHVGLWRDMQAFARETRRVARSYYVQTPNYWFPIDPHFWRMPIFHWLPRPVRAGLVRVLPLAAGGRAEDLSKAYEMVDSARLLTRGQMRYLFPEGHLQAERLMLLPKSYMAVAADGAPHSAIEEANPIHA